MSQALALESPAPLEPEHAAWLQEARTGLANALDPDKTPQFRGERRAVVVADWRAEVTRRTPPEAWAAELARRAEEVARVERERLEREEAREARERQRREEADRETEARRLADEAAKAARKAARAAGYRWNGGDCPACHVKLDDCKCERAPWTGAIEVRCDYRIVSPRDSEDRFVRASRRRSERRSMAVALRPYAPPDVAGKPPGSVVVTFTRYGVHPIDDDALAYAYKSLRDEIAIWLRTKDSPSSPPVWRYEQVRHAVKVPDKRKDREGHYRFEVYTVVRIVEARP